MAKVVTITNPVTGQPAQVDQLDHTAQQIDDAVEAAKNAVNKAGDTMTGALTVRSNQTSAPLSVEPNAVGLGASLIRFSNNGSVWGLIGFSAADNPVVQTADGLHRYTILHTGNKPSGSYTGNGSASERSISMVGAVGNAVLIWSDNGSVIVTRVGGVGSKSFGYGDCHFEGNYTKIASTDSLLNANGVTYKYQVL